jgi:N-glycosylase/DNA lyase
MGLPHQAGAVRSRFLGGIRKAKTGSLPDSGMERGAISLSSVGPFDLQSTVESGQSYLWSRADGQTYDNPGAYGGHGWYVTTARVDSDPVVIRVRQRDDRLEWESSVDALAVVRDRLRLADDLPQIRSATPDDDVVQQAYDAYWGMHLVRDPPFPTLVSFICSAQMRVARIHGMQQRLRRAYGTPLEFAGETYAAFPTPEQLADATEAELRDLGLGYRAPYVLETAQMVADGVGPGQAAGRAYEEAREWLTRFTGVGRKVADCILLFSLGYLQSVPLDTWIRTTIEDYYPDCDQGSYIETSRAIRAALGGEYAGYVQTYIFHYLR